MGHGCWLVWLEDITPRSLVCDLEEVEAKEEAGQEERSSTMEQVWGGSQCGRFADQCQRISPLRRPPPLDQFSPFPPHPLSSK